MLSGPAGSVSTAGSGRATRPVSEPVLPLPQAANEPATRPRSARAVNRAHFLLLARPSSRDGVNVQLARTLAWRVAPGTSHAIERPSTIVKPSCGPNSGTAPWRGSSAGDLFLQRWRPRRPGTQQRAFPGTLCGMPAGTAPEGGDGACRRPRIQGPEVQRYVSSTSHFCLLRACCTQGQLSPHRGQRSQIRDFRTGVAVAEALTW